MKKPFLLDGASLYPIKKTAPLPKRSAAQDQGGGCCGTQAPIQPVQKETPSQGCCDSAPVEAKDGTCCTPQTAAAGTCC